MSANNSSNHNEDDLLEDVYLDEEDSEEVSPIVTFYVKDNLYGVSTAQVLNMLAMPEIRPVPHAPYCVRGVINLRGEVLPVVDLRARLGLSKRSDELKQFSDMMNQREQDHRNWLSELKNSTEEHRPFNLTTDPHQCAFGKWYDKFQTDDQVVKSILKRFDAPHRKIHGVAVKVGKKLTDGDFEGAQNIITKTQDKELVQMINLFQTLKAHYQESSREQAIILEAPDFNYALAVDRIDSVEFLDDSFNEVSSDGLGDSQDLAIAGLGKRNNSNQMVQLMTAGGIIAGVEVREFA